ncbi:unnamed protein product [Scytosiphon promiscuus]
MGNASSPSPEVFCFLRARGAQDGRKTIRSAFQIIAVVVNVVRQLHGKKCGPSSQARKKDECEKTRERQNREWRYWSAVFFFLPGAQPLRLSVDDTDKVVQPSLLRKEQS